MSKPDILSFIHELVSDANKLAKFKEIVSDIKELIADIKSVFQLINPH